MKTNSYTLRFVLQTLLFAIVALSIGSLLTGCMGYAPSREISIVNADGSSYHSKERAPLVTLFKEGEADLVSSKVRENRIKGTYERDIGVKKIKTSGDAESITATGEAVGNGAKAFVKP